MDNKQRENLSSMELDTIGEIMNISMGSAATAVSNLLDKQVIISTPSVTQKKFDSLEYAAMEPAMLVSISYVEGLSGTNVMVFRQRDMQIILGLLMGNEDEPTDDFEFDELSMSAACEVMNQMMGSSATALSEFLGMVVNISTPEAKIVSSENEYQEAIGVTDEEEIVAITFKLDIVGVMSSDFASVLPIELAKEIVTRVTSQTEDQIGAIEESEPAPAPQPPAPAPAPQPAAPAPNAAAIAGGVMSQSETDRLIQQRAAAAQQAAAAQAQPPQPMPAQQMPQQMPGQMGQMQQPPQGMPGQMPQQMPGQMPQYPGMPQYPQAPQMQGYPNGYMQPYAPGPYMYPQPGMLPYTDQQPITIKNTQFPVYTPQVVPGAQGGNMDLLLGVNLDVAVQIGKTKRKIKDIVEFGQGTVIELDKQAGAPVDIMVNGRLLAHGDVVVIDDNFGVRITEIVGTKELMDSLKEENL